MKAAIAIGCVQFWLTGSHSTAKTTPGKGWKRFERVKQFGSGVVRGNAFTSQCKESKQNISHLQVIYMDMLSFVNANMAKCSFK